MQRYRLPLFIGLLMVHLGITVMAMVNVGFIGIFEKALANWGAGQVTSDLTVALVLINVWIIGDARKQGIRAWPWVLLSLPLGSIASLAYLIRRELAVVEAPAARRAARA